jgi:hypothetical protein
MRGIGGRHRTSDSRFRLARISQAVSLALQEPGPRPSRRSGSRSGPPLLTPEWAVRPRILRPCPMRRMDGTGDGCTSRTTVARARRLSSTEVCSIRSPTFVNRPWRRPFPARRRLRSLVIGGNQPYAWPDSPLVRTVNRRAVSGPHGGHGGTCRRLRGFLASQIPRRPEGALARKRPPCDRRRLEHGDGRGCDRRGSTALANAVSDLPRRGGSGLPRRGPPRSTRSRTPSCCCSQSPTTMPHTSARTKWCSRLPYECCVRADRVAPHLRATFDINA